MGFLLGLEHANMTMMSSSKTGSRASSRKCSLEVGDLPNAPVIGKVNSHEIGQNTHFDAHTMSEVWMKEREVSDIHCRLEPQFCDHLHDCQKTHDSEIRHRFGRAMRKLSAKLHLSEKSSLAGIDKTTSEVVTGVRYSVDYSAEDKISGRPSSSSAFNSSENRSPQDTSVVNSKPVQRASI